MAGELHTCGKIRNQRLVINSENAFVSNPQFSLISEIANQVQLGTFSHFSKVWNILSIATLSRSCSANKLRLPVTVGNIVAVCWIGVLQAANIFSVRSHILTTSNRFQNNAKRRVKAMNTITRILKYGWTDYLFQPSNQCSIATKFKIATNCYYKPLYARFLSFLFRSCHNLVLPWSNFVNRKAANRELVSTYTFQT